MRFVLLLLACLLLTACSALYSNRVDSDGAIHTSVLGVDVAVQPPAQPTEGEVAPWQVPEFAQLSAEAQLAVLFGWNAWRGGSLPPPSVPWASIIGLVLGGASGSNLLSSLASAALGAATKGAANVAVAIKPSVPASWPQTILAGLSLLSPVHGIGPATSTAHLAAVAATKAGAPA